VIVTEIEFDCEFVGDSEDVADKEGETDCDIDGEDVIEELIELEGKTEVEMDGEDVIEDDIELDDDFVGEELGKA
jgi:hypothetical protein